MKCWLLTEKKIVVRETVDHKCRRYTSRWNLSVEMEDVIWIVESQCNLLSGTPLETSFVKWYAAGIMSYLEYFLYKLTHFKFQFKCYSLQLIVMNNDGYLKIRYNLCYIISNIYSWSSYISIFFFYISIFLIVFSMYKLCKLQTFLVCSKVLFLLVTKRIIRWKIFRSTNRNRWVFAAKFQFVSRAN